MTYKVYIQSLNGFPVDDWAVSAYLGFKGNGTEVIFFEEIEEVPRSKWNIVVASIEATNSYLERMGLPPQKALNIPFSLTAFADRKFWRESMGVVRRIWKDFPIFIKPDENAKAFPAGVLEDKSWLDRHLLDVKDDVPTFLSEVVNFVTEYRAYVVDGEMIGLYYYKGDFRIFPDVKVIDKAIGEYQYPPAGYSMDFGVTEDGRTLLIECNDGWSLGNYGLEASKYSRLLGKRWHELMKTVK